MKPLTPNLPERESRFISGKIELRAAAEMEGRNKVFGYAAIFGNESSVLEARQGKFVEVIESGAFDDVLNDDIRALFNHDPNMILARSKGGIGSMKIGTDAIGLWYEFEIPDTQIGRDLRTIMDRGDIDSSSFGFIVGKDNIEKRADGMFVRTISKIKELLDVSLVTYPAYPDATVALRSLEEFRKEPEAPEPTEENSVSLWERRFAFISKFPTA